MELKALAPASSKQRHTTRGHLYFQTTVLAREPVIHSGNLKTAPEKLYTATKQLQKYPHPQKTLNVDSSDDKHDFHNTTEQIESA